ncbi:MAG: (Fe-S)-binding protein, partial [bacterium]
GKTRSARAVINAIMRLHPRRTLPPFSKSLYALWPRTTRHARTPTPRVAIFADCFTTYNESHIGLAAQRVLEKLGYHPELPGSNWAGGCCGRSMISVGLLPGAVAMVDATIAQLRPLIEDDAVGAILFLEPSCLSAVKDDWLELKCQTPLALRQRLADKSFLIEDFLDRHWDKHPNASLLANAAARAQARNPHPVVLHAHCHQKAHWGTGTSSTLLSRILGTKLRTPDTGCCGMAGSFGYDREKFDLSMAIGNLPSGGILPIARSAGAQETICATGTSCRHQIKDGAGRAALHPIQLIDQLLAD